MQPALHVHSVPRVHAPARVADLHQDLLSHVGDPAVQPAARQTGWDELERSAVRLVVASTWPRPPIADLFDPAVNDVMEELLRAYRHAARERPGWRLVTRREDLAALTANAERGVLVHVEGLNRFDGDWARLERWHALGWRSLGIVWNDANALGGGAGDRRTGLTPLGHEVLGWAQARGVLVDLAHMNEATFRDALAATTGPVLVSHANARALCDHPRNLADDQLRAVAERGGVVGVVAARDFVARRGPSVSGLADHVEHIARVAGSEHVALGTDFGGVVGAEVPGFATLERLPALWGELGRRGWDAPALERVAWGNAARVLAAVLPA